MTSIQSPIILIVEDNPGQQVAMSLFLTELGWRTIIAVDGVEAVRAVRDEAIDLVLMDLNLPVLDGYGAAREIRAMTGDAGKLPIIAVSSNSEAAARPECLACGMNDFVSKPVDRQSLLAAIKKVLPVDPPDIGAPFQLHSSLVDQEKAADVLNEIDNLLSD